MQRAERGGGINSAGDEGDREGMDQAPGADLATQWRRATHPSPQMVPKETGFAMIASATKGADAAVYGSTAVTAGHCE